MPKAPRPPAAVMTSYTPPTVEQEVKNRQESENYHQRADEVNQRLANHDTAGYETDLITLDRFDDGYGNNVAHGDLSAQRMVENGARSCHYVGQPYDREPVMRYPK